jgi:hypothetical protein
MLPDQPALFPDEPLSPGERARHPLGIYALPKPIGEMDDAEIDAWANTVVGGMARQYERHTGVKVPTAAPVKPPGA